MYHFRLFLSTDHFIKVAGNIIGPGPKTQQQPHAQPPQHTHNTHLQPYRRVVKYHKPAAVAATNTAVAAVPVTPVHYFEKVTEDGSMPSQSHNNSRGHSQQQSQQQPSVSNNGSAAVSRTVSNAVSEITLDSHIQPPAQQTNNTHAHAPALPTKSTAPHFVPHKPSVPKKTTANTHYTKPIVAAVSHKPAVPITNHVNKNTANPKPAASVPVKDVPVRINEYGDPVDDTSHDSGCIEIHDFYEQDDFEVEVEAGGSILFGRDEMEEEKSEILGTWCDFSVICFVLFTLANIGSRLLLYLFGFRLFWWLIMQTVILYFFHTWQ